MKSPILFLLSTYQTVVSPLVHQLFGLQTACRFEVTCSNYAKQAIVSHGVIKGSFYSLSRLLRCQPILSL